MSLVRSFGCFHNVWGDVIAGMLVCWFSMADDEKTFCDDAATIIPARRATDNTVLEDQLKKHWDRIAMIATGTCCGSRNEDDNDEDPSSERKIVASFICGNVEQHYALWALSTACLLRPFNSMRKNNVSTIARQPSYHLWAASNNKQEIIIYFFRCVSVPGYSYES